MNRLKQTEVKLRYEKAYAESIVETVRHPLVVLDEKLRVTSANRAFCDISQVESDLATGRPLYELSNGLWDVPHLRELLEDVIPRQSAFQDFRMDYEFPQIGRKIMLLSGRRIEPVGGVPARLLLVIEDVTRRERDRAALAALNRDLEQRVADRTALVMHRSRQLRSLASELARGEQRERERLTRMLHDDLQQLLVGAKIQLATMRSKGGSEFSQEAVDLMETLLNQSMEATRSLTMELSPAVLYEGGLDAAIQWLARQNQTRYGVTVQTDINTKVERDEEGVAILLFQAVRELLLNVVKHAQVQSARVQLDRDADDQVHIVVSDEGVGFDPAGFQAGGHSGTGLGLLGLRERMEQIGGTCDIDSRPGHGTRVTLAVKVERPPARPATVAARQPREEIAAAALGSPGTRSGKIRLLLADDCATVRQLLAGFLSQEADIEVAAEAVDGREAITLARKLGPDVILMDSNMPVVNGWEATLEITSALPGIRVIALSAFEDDAAASAMLDAGAVACVTKGGPSEQLLAAIRSAAGRSEG